MALSFGYLQLFCGGQPFHGYEMNESDRGGYNDKNLNEDGEYQDYLKEKHFGNRDMIDKELETRKDPQDNWGLSVSASHKFITYEYGQNHYVSNKGSTQFGEIDCLEPPRGRNQNALKTFIW